MAEEQDSIISELSGRLLRQETPNIYYNLALDHALLDMHRRSPNNLTVRLWRSQPSVVLGRSQKLAQEIVTGYCEQSRIEIARRISGGGTVYLDPGIIVISFISPRKIVPQNSDFSEIMVFFTKILLRSLRRTGITDLEMRGTSNILFQGKKISGAAGYHSKEGILHHATLLIEGNLKHLEGSLMARDMNPEDAWASRYFPTTNLSSLDLDEWERELCDEVTEKFHISLTPGELTEVEITRALQLEGELYTKTTWIRQGRRGGSKD